MASEWRVCGNDPIEKLESNLWRVEGKLPKDPPFRRVMTVARLADGRLVIHNAICMDDASMAELEAWGKPAFLIVPGARHRIDAPAFKARYPQITVVTPPGARAAVAKMVAVDTSEPDFGDPSVRWLPLDGVGGGECALEVTSGDSVTLVLNDSVMNMRPISGFMGFMFGLVGFTGPTPKVSGPTRMALMKDKRAMRASLEKLAATPRLARVIVSHGAPIDAAGLATAAATL